MDSSLDVQMTPSPAEIARTISSGRLPGTLRIDGNAVPGAHHAVGTLGRPLLLTRDDAAHAPCWHARTRTPSVELTVPDVPPLPGAPGLGWVRLTGALRRLRGTEVRSAVLEFAEVNPVEELFDVGSGCTIHTVAVDHVRVERQTTTSYIDALDYAAAEPDPLHEVERDLLTDLADHHPRQAECFFRCALAAAGMTPRATPRAVRLDRYGFLLDLGEPEHSDENRWVRARFRRPVASPHDLAHLLHPVLFHHDHPHPS